MNIAKTVVVALSAILLSLSGSAVAGPDRAEVDRASYETKTTTAPRMGPSRSTAAQQRPVVRQSAKTPQRMASTIAPRMGRGGSVARQWPTTRQSTDILQQATPTTAPRMGRSG